MPNNDKLTPEQITQNLTQLPQWQAIHTEDVPEPSAIEQLFEFPNFQKAFAFISEIALLAEKLNHHPDIHNSYNRVIIRLTSHDVKGISTRDINMAQKIDKLIKTTQ